MDSARSVVNTSSDDVHLSIDYNNINIPVFEPGEYSDEDESYPSTQENDTDGDIKIQQIESSCEQILDKSMEVEEKISSNNQMNLYLHSDDDALKNDAEIPGGESVSDSEDQSELHKGNNKSELHKGNNKSELHKGNNKSFSSGESGSDSEDQSELNKGNNKSELHKGNNKSVSSDESVSDSEDQSELHKGNNKSVSSGESGSDSEDQSELHKGNNKSELNKGNNKSVSSGGSGSDSEDQSELNKGNNKSVSGCEIKSNVEDKSELDDITNKSKSDGDALDNDAEIHQPLLLKDNQLDDNKEAKSDYEDKYNQVPNTALNDSSISSSQIDMVSLS